jgi:hypothetical protein
MSRCQSLSISIWREGGMLGVDARAVRRNRASIPRVDAQDEIKFRDSRIPL